MTGKKRVKMPDGWDTGAGGHGSFHRDGREKGKTRKQDATAATAGAVGGSSGRRMAGFNDRWDAAEARGAVREGRFLRNYEAAPLTVWEIAIEPFKGAHFATFPTELVRRCLLAGCPKGGRVLDPFGGAGTTGLVADRMGLECTLIELNPEYTSITENRIDADAGMFSSVSVEAAEVPLLLPLAGAA